MKNVLVEVEMWFVNACLWAVLRRWYGGGFDEKYSWLGNRGLQTFVMISVLFFTLLDSLIWWQALLLPGRDSVRLARKSPRLDYENH